jgi:hypothetical protein
LKKILTLKFVPILRFFLVSINFKKNTKKQKRSSRKEQTIKEQKKNEKSNRKRETVVGPAQHHHLVCSAP